MIKMKKSLSLPFLLLLGSALLATSVSAYSSVMGGGVGGILGSISQIFGGQDFGAIYTQYWWIIDFIIYAFFFSYIGKLGMRGKFEGAANGLGVVIGFALAASVVVFESKSGFRMANVGPFALAVALIAFVVVVHNFLKGLFPNHGMLAKAVAFIAGYGFLLSMFGPFMNQLASSDNWIAQMAFSILNLLMIIAVIALISQIIKLGGGMFKGGGGGGLGGNLSNISGAGPGAGGADPQLKRNEQDDKKIEITEARHEGQDAVDAEGAAQAEGEASKDLMIEFNSMRSIANFLTQLRDFPLTPQGAKAIAAARAKALIEAVQKLLDYSKRAQDQNKRARNSLERVIKRIGKELKDEARLKANAAKKAVKLTADEKKLGKKAGASALNVRQTEAENAVITQYNAQIAQRLVQLRLEAFQGENTEKNIEEALGQLEQTEKAIMAETRMLVTDLEQANLTAVQQTTINLLNAIGGAETAMSAAERMILVVRNYAKDLEQKFFMTRKAVIQTAMAKEMEIVKGI